MSATRRNAGDEKLAFAAPPAGAITVTQLTALIRGALTAALPDRLRVAGELSNVSRPSSGHVYFTLKDAGSEVRCAMWKSAAQSLRFNPADGLAVVATGTVDVYEPRGQVQLHVQRLEPVGVGALELAFRQLREKLQRAGLFDPARKRPLPPIPSRIAIVTSLSGAAVRDIVQTIRRRFPCVDLLIHPVRVQGDGAAAEIATAIATINRDRAALGGIDVMIVGRGGGSLEDLWPFNEEVVARAIYASAIPVVSAVGHEVDVTIADLVADVRAATPTAAAEMVAPVRTELLAHAAVFAGRLLRATAGRCDAARSRLSRAMALELFRDPTGWLRRHEQRCDDSATRLRAAVVQRMSAGRRRLHEGELRLFRVRPEAELSRRRERLADLDHRLRWAQGHLNLVAERRLAAAQSALLRASPRGAVDRGLLLLAALQRRATHALAEHMRQRGVAVAHLAARLAASSHRSVLARGFSITRMKRSGQVIRGPADVREGDRVTTETADGAFDSRVTDARQADLFD